MKPIDYFSKNINKTIFLLFCILSTGVFAQDADNATSTKSQFKLHKKGEYFINWGYNRSWYNKSDIHFYGQGHDFTLNQVKAADRPSKLSLDYINPLTWSIPQFNFHAGYFLTDKFSISVGWDHMKYVMRGNQTVTMYGYIDPSEAIDPAMKANMEAVNAKYSSTGLYDNLAVELTGEDFIRYEHTDGLNYASVEFERYFELWQSTRNEKIL